MDLTLSCRILCWWIHITYHEFRNIPMCCVAAIATTENKKKREHDNPIPWTHDLPSYWAPSQYPKRRLSVRSRKVSKPRDWYFKLSYRFEIWQAHRQHCCRSACQISERSGNSKYKSRGFETLRDLTERRLFGYWDGALVLTGGFPTQSTGNTEGWWFLCC